MATVDTSRMLAAHPEWIAPRSDLRVFLGEPGAPEATKTTVEPGNAFSPGMRTFGVTWWLRFPAGDTFFAPETAPLDALRWRYEAGYLPLIHCDVDVESLAVRHSLFQDGTAGEQSEAVCGRLHLTNTGRDSVSVQVILALRSLGPAGGPVPALAVGADGASLKAGDGDTPLLAVDRAPTAIGCGVGDPTPWARAGMAPPARSVADPDGWCFGLLRYNVTLPPGETWCVHIDCPQQTYGNLRDELPSTAVPAPARYDTRATAHLDQWRARLGAIGLDVPECAFHDAFMAGLGHMLTAMVGDQARIAPLTYPLPWLRDSAYIIRCLDLAGLHDVARAATEYCARNDFFGGFGAEGDAPGQGIWVLVEHYRLTGDAAWLASVYPAIRRKCAWIARMRRTDRPLQVAVDTPVLSFTHAERAAGVICLAARDGVIMGAMDHGVAHAVGWVNHWALCGLRAATDAARVLGQEDDAAAYDAERAALWAALQAFADATPAFFTQERTVNSLLWPTLAWAAAPDRARQGFDAWWLDNRGHEDGYQPEPYWLYFEFAQAHNALLFGERERAWQVVEYRLRHQDLPGLYGWREGGDGVGTENALHGVTLIDQLRGCQRVDSITPHGWSQAELWLLQRALLVEEWGEGLLLFAGVPAHWLEPSARVAFHAFPTRYGCVSAELQVDADGRGATIVVSGAREGTPLWIRLPGGEIETASDGVTLSIRLDLARDR